MMELAMRNELHQELHNDTRRRLQAEREASRSASWHLYAVGALTLLWSLYGAARFTMSQLGLAGEGATASAELAHFASMPIWVGAFWALTVWGSVAGGALLLLRSSWAVQGFVVAVIGLIGTSAYQFVFAEVPASIYDMPIALATWIIALVSMLFASMARDAGHLGR